MPVFQETSNAARDLRILPSRAIPLPRLSSKPEAKVESVECREVVVIGAGPSGLFLTLLLARYGVTASSLVCLDAKPGTLKAGQADGLQPRTLEVLQSLGIASEIIAEGCHMEEVAFWNPINHEKAGIQRTAFVPDVNVTARYPFEVTIHQGRIERILQENLNLYAPTDTIRRSHRFLEYEVDPVKHPDFPILVKYECDLEDGTIAQASLRTKYLVGADGAHSKVRKCMGLDLEGETSDHIWGVCDFVAKTDFPDIRNRCAVHSSSGSVMVIPREQIATGDYLTRLYVQVPEEIDPNADLTVTGVGDEKKATSKKRRAEVTLDYIFGQARAVFAPYTIEMKQGTTPDWWAAYQIGQRMSSKFSSTTSDGVERVFIVGDACHTHSPKAGQGMNVSMMDSYNLAWKLVHRIHGLTPSSKSPSDPVLATFHSERHDTARQLIEFDTKFSHMFSGKMGVDEGSSSNLTHEEFVKVFSEGSGFTSGCGLQYGPSCVIAESDASSVKTNGDPLAGALTLGRRLLNVEVKRFADNTTRQLHDELPSTGRYRLVVFAANDMLGHDSVSQLVLNSCGEIMLSHPAGSIDFAVIHPLRERFEWTDLPKCTKEFAEMRTYGLSKKEDAYEIYGVAKDQGAVIVVRPDGYVGIISSLSSLDQVKGYLNNCLVSVS